MIKFTLSFKCPTCINRTTEVPIAINDEKTEELLLPYAGEIARRTTGPVHLQASGIQCDICKSQQKTLGLSEFLCSIRNPSIPSGVVQVVVNHVANPPAPKKDKAAPKGEDKPS